MRFSIFEDEILGHSHLIKEENHEKLIENIRMRGSDCDFWIFQAFSDKYGKFQSPFKNILSACSRKKLLT